MGTIRPHPIAGRGIQARHGNRTVKADPPAIDRPDDRPAAGITAGHEPATECQEGRRRPRCSEVEVAPSSRQCQASESAGIVTRNAAAAAACFECKAQTHRLVEVAEGRSRRAGCCIAIDENNIGERELEGDESPDVRAGVARYRSSAQVIPRRFRTYREDIGSQADDADFRPR